MALRSEVLHSAVRPRAVQRTRALWYSMYGLSFRSEIPLPLTATLPPAPAPADVEIRRFTSEECPVPQGVEIGRLDCLEHGADMRVTRGPSGAWIWCNAIGTFHISADLRSVDAYIDIDADPKAPGLALAGPVVVFLLHMLGRPILHASCVALADGAVAFLASSGGGKSSIAAGFLRAGAALLCDDALPLRVVDGAVWAEPGVPFIKIWPETATRALGIERGLPDLMSQTDKKMLQLEGDASFAAAPMPLRAIYLVDRYDPVAARTTEIRVTRLSLRDSVAVLVAHTAMRFALLGREEARLLPVYSRLVAGLPVCVLSFPDGYEHQAAVRARVIAQWHEDP